MQGNAVAYPITINFQVYIQRVLEELLALQGRACFIQSPKRISHPSAETCRLPAALSHLFKHNYISTMFIQQTPRHQPGRSCGSKVYPLVFLLNSRNISSSIHDSQDTGLNIRPCRSCLAKRETENKLSQNKWDFCFDSSFRYRVK